MNTDSRQSYEQGGRRRYREDSRHGGDDFGNEPIRHTIPKRQVVRRGGKGNAFLVGFGVISATLIATVAVIVGTYMMPKAPTPSEAPQEQVERPVTEGTESAGAASPAAEVLSPTSNVSQSDGVVTTGDIASDNPTQTFFESRGELSDASALGYLGEKLADEPKRIYLQLHAAISGGRENVSILEVYDESSIKVAWETLFDDHPEFFWLDGQYKYVFDPITHTLNVQFGLCIPLYERDAYRQQIDSRVIEFQNSLPANASQYDIALKAYEYIIYNTEYDDNAQYNQNIISVFSYRRSVCAGYARAYQYLLHRSGLFCSFVHGNGHTEDGGEESHAWNLICIDGTYAYVDTTWGDKNPRMVAQGQADWGEIRYAFFGMPTSEIKQTGHTFLDESLWPPCDSYDLNVYKRSGMLWDGYDRGSFHDVIRAYIANGASSMEFQFTNPDAYHACMQDVVTEECLEELPDWMDVHKAEWTFLSNDTTRTVRFKWWKA